MATVWVLVARLQAEFPGLSIAKVLSARQLQSRDGEESDLGLDIDIDVIISTVPLGDEIKLSLDVPVIVVNPLLSVIDIRAVAELV